MKVEAYLECLQESQFSKEKKSLAFLIADYHKAKYGEKEDALNLKNLLSKDLKVVTTINNTTAVEDYDSYLYRVENLVFLTTIYCETISYSFACTSSQINMSCTTRQVHAASSPQGAAVRKWIVCEEEILKVDMGKIVEINNKSTVKEWSI